MWDPGVHMTDILIKNGLIVDGTGNQPFQGDITIDGGIITDIGNLEDLEADQIIDAGGRVIAPGFIDMHSHSDVLFADGLDLMHKVWQGVTTELVGQDGFSAAPVTAGCEPHVASFFDQTAGQLKGGWKPWDTTGFLNRVASQQIPINMATLTGNANLRLAVFGHRMATASKRELVQLCEILDESMGQGSFGMSLGLIYPPSAYSDTAELITLGQVIQKHDGMIVSHMRNEQANIIEAVEEMLSIGEQSGCRIHISHLKCLGKPSWGKMTRILELLDQAADRGLEVSFDQYPYDASNTALSALIPGWALEGGYAGFSQTVAVPESKTKILAIIKENIKARGGEEAIIIAAVLHDKYRELVGQSVKGLARFLDMPAEKAVLNLLLEEELQVLAIYHAISESDVELAMQHHMQTVGSDGVLSKYPHPRAFGTFPRVIHRYSGEKKLFPLEEAIRKMTSKPADLLRLKKRGRIGSGYHADLVMFRAGEFVDQATFSNPDQMATGMDWVFVNGKPLISEGKPTGLLPGTVLKAST